MDGGGKVGSSVVWRDGHKERWREGGGRRRVVIGGGKMVEEIGNQSVIICY